MKQTAKSWVFNKIEKKNLLNFLSDTLFSQNNVKTTAGLYIHHAFIYCNIDMIHDHIIYHTKSKE